MWQWKTYVPVKSTNRVHIVTQPPTGIAKLSHQIQGLLIGTPEDWKWPPGRIDQWGASAKDMARIAEAEKAFAWASR